MLVSLRFYVKRGISLPPVLISASKTAAPKKSCLPIRTLLLLQLNGKRVVMEKSVAAPWIQLLHSVRTPPELASHRPSVGRRGGRRVVEAQRTSSLLPATAVLLSLALDGVGRDTGAVQTIETTQTLNRSQTDDDRGMVACWDTEYRASGYRLEAMPRGVWKGEGRWLLASPTDAQLLLPECELESPFLGDSCLVKSDQPINQK